MSFACSLLVPKIIIIGNKSANVPFLSGCLGYAGGILWEISALSPFFFQ
jgi:hypothetical protein